ncbi:hypothetical protein [Aminobacter carboxidus]|uniref:Uncharacterized protein YoxC n=1 Tax=Aminobacter carboxidus TaxID=376165 RepID=A0A8E1WM12_9HYPH|nr:MULTISPECIES: hypothetical protein [Aminobacter carboxidus group]MBB6470269.1 uncharacterized protein YoxC [Aminobacter lissarensis]
MGKNTGMQAMLVAVALAVLAMFVIGFMDRARDPVAETTQHTLDH